MIEVFYIHNKNIPEEKFLSIAEEHKFVKGSLEDNKIIMINMDDEYRNMVHVINTILNLNEQGYTYPNDFETSTAH